MLYPGSDRRLHKVFVTQNTEYHIRDRLCVGVRDRRSGQWMKGHLALKTRVCGGLRFGGRGGIAPRTGQPLVGESLFFQGSGRDLVTSTVLAIERPERAMVQSYLPS